MFPSGEGLGRSRRDKEQKSNHMVIVIRLSRANILSVALHPYHVSDIVLSERGDDVKIKPSTALRNEYPQISELVKETGEPIIITNKGEADLIVMSVAAFEEREKMFRHRDKIYAAEVARVSSISTYTSEQIRGELEALYETAGK